MDNFNSDQFKTMVDNVVLDCHLLRIQWSIDEVTDSVEKLISLLEKINDMELLEAINEHLQALHSYVQLVGRDEK